MLAAASPAEAQRCDQAVKLVATVREATARYRNPELAKRDGYRNISHDFPGMGEHWINVGLATADTFDAQHPSILLYARTKDRLELVGAAFTSFLDAGEKMPGPAFLASKWHGHAGTLDDELFAARHGDQIRTDEFNVLVLHVWTWLPNNVDPFAVENWRLPALRAGLRHDPPNPDAARAQSLLTSAEYYRIALGKLGVPSSAQTELIAVIRRYGAEAAAQKEPSKLAGVWRRFIGDIAYRWPQTRGGLSRLTRSTHETTTCGNR
jgi:hypothetical protein